MTKGEKFIAIAENEEIVFLSGKEEGYAEGCIAGKDADNPEVDALLEQIIAKQNNIIGYNVTVCPLSATWSKDCYVSKTKPNNLEDYDAHIYGDSDPVLLAGVKTLYIWQNSSGNAIRVSESNEHDGGEYINAYTYANAYELTISSDKTIYCIGDAG